MTFFKKLLFIFVSIIIIYFLFLQKKKVTENFITVDDLPENIKREIGKAYNVVVLSPNQKVLPITKPVEMKKIDPYDNLSVCTIDRQFKNNYQGKYDSQGKYDYNRSDKKSGTSKKSKTNTEKYKVKKFYDNYYGIASAPDSEEYKASLIYEENEEKYDFIQGNICKLSPWSLWSECDYNCGKHYGKKTRNRRVLKEPKGCYSPLNPVLTQTIPCNSSLCFCNLGC